MLKSISCLLLSAVLLTLTSCSTRQLTVVDLTPRLGDGLHVQKVDNLLILVDDPGGAIDRYLTYKRDRAFTLVDRIKITVADMPLQQGIRIFGPNADMNDMQISLLYGMIHHKKTGIIEPSIVTSVPHNSQFDPVAMALEALYHELKSVQGNSAVIVISDFQKSGSKSLETAEMINKHYEGQVCIYPVQEGSSESGALLAGQLAKAAGCGFTATVDQLKGPNALADYLEMVLYDIVDPVPMPEPISLVPLAATKDEVKKPELSYQKLMIEKELRVELKTNFELDKFTVRPEYHGHLQEIADFMKKYPDTSAVIGGHTCSLGPEKYNMKLSRKRADAVKEYLVKKLAIGEERLFTIAYGETKPVADNSTEEGRQQNRRVVAVIVTTVTEEQDASIE